GVDAVPAQSDPARDGAVARDIAGKDREVVRFKAGIGKGRRGGRVDRRWRSRLANGNATEKSCRQNKSAQRGRNEGWFHGMHFVTSGRFSPGSSMSRGRSDIRNAKRVQTCPVASLPAVHNRGTQFLPA